MLLLTELPDVVVAEGLLWLATFVTGALTDVLRAADVFLLTVALLADVVLRDAVVTLFVGCCDVTRVTLLPLPALALVETLLVKTLSEPVRLLSVFTLSPPSDGGAGM